MNYDLQKISKAIAGGLMAVIAGLLVKYGLNPSPEVASAINILVDAAVLYAVGHVGVYLAPKNKETK